MAARPRRTAGAPPTPDAALAHFADALRGAGMTLKGSPVMDGTWRRAPLADDGKGKRSGTYCGYADGWPRGFIHNHRTGVTVTWRADADETAKADPAQVERALREARAVEAVRAEERRAREATVARRARTLWAGCPEAAGDHPYLVRKGVAAHGLRQDRRDNLLVPMRGPDGALWSLQRIRPEKPRYGADKPYLKGGRVRGTFAMLGDPGGPGGLFVAEGYATAATVYEATGRATAVAFTAHNLLAVARALRAAHPGRPIAVAADNDHHLPRRASPLPNIGLEKAREAAAAVGGVVVAPDFPPASPDTDWNDYARRHGAEAARAAIGSALRTALRGGAFSARLRGARTGRAAQETHMADNDQKGQQGISQSGHRDGAQGQGTGQQGQQDATQAGQKLTPEQQAEQQRKKQAQQQGGQGGTSGTLTQKP